MRVDPRSGVSSRGFSALAVTVLLLAGGCARDGEDVNGPEWSTAIRYGAGAAGPAELAGMAVEEHEAFDRLMITFVGKHAGYRVRYDDGDRNLVVTLRGMRDTGGWNTRPALAAITEVRRPPSSGGIVRADVVVSDGELPFRIGLSAGGFYIDVAHPGATSSA